MIRLWWKAPLSKAAKLLTTSEWFFYGFTFGRHGIGIIVHHKELNND